MVMAILAVAACTREQEAPPKRASGETAAALDPCAGNGRLTAGGVGSVKIGARVHDIAGVCKLTDTSLTLSEGQKERAHIVTVGGSRLIVLSTGTKDTTITRVIVADSSYRTDRGIGVGSTVGDLRKAYGQVCAAFGERGVVVSAGSLPGVSFQTALTAADVRVGGRALEEDPSVVPDTAPITSAWATAGPKLCGGS
jgi:hypothetical protein